MSETHTYSDADPDQAPVAVLPYASADRERVETPRVIRQLAILHILFGAGTICVAILLAVFMRFARDGMIVWSVIVAHGVAFGLPAVWLMRKGRDAIDGAIVPALISGGFFLIPLLYAIFLAYVLAGWDVPWQILLIRFGIIWAFGSAGVFLNLYTARTVLSIRREQTADQEQPLWPERILVGLWYAYWLLFAVIGALLVAT